MLFFVIFGIDKLSEKGEQDFMNQKLTAEEIRLWKAQLKGVKPLSKTVKEPNVIEEQKQEKKPPLQKPTVKKQLIVSPPSLPPQSFSRKELRHVNIEARLDLHGMTLEGGYQALEQFLRRAQERGFKTVLVITGKGSLSSERTLRHQLPRWLQETPLRSLVSFLHHPAKPQDGGQGAFYVGVRKKGAV